MSEYIFKLYKALYNEETGEAVFKPEVMGKLVRCKDCKFQNEFGTLSGKNKKFCEINITGALGEDKDFCSAGKRRET